MRTHLDDSTTESAVLAVVHRLVFLVLCAYLLFAHGCHSDKDTELTDRYVPIVGRVLSMIGIQ